MIKKVVILATVVVSMTLFAFTPPNTTLIRSGEMRIERSGENYLVDDVPFSQDDYRAFDEMEADGADIKRWYEENGATDFFIIRCQTSFNHGLIMGSGCCTSPHPAPDDCPAYLKAQIDEMQARVDVLINQYQ